MRGSTVYNITGKINVELLLETCPLLVIAVWESTSSCIYLLFCGYCCISHSTSNI